MRGFVEGALPRAYYFEYVDRSPGIAHNHDVMLAILVFLIGLVLGSFANVVIYRLPRGESILFPGSKCPHCGHPIRPYDNIPVVGYLLLRGRCRDCGALISLRYPLVELVSGIFLLLLYRRYGFSPAFFGYSLFSLMLLAIFFIDLDHRIIPNLLTYPGIAAGLIFSTLTGRLTNAIGAALGAGLFFVVVILVSRGGMGWGDAKLGAMMGAFLGWPLIAVALVISFVFGGIVGLLLVLLKLRTRKDVIPFGPALALGGMIALLWGEALLRWYLGR